MAIEACITAHAGQQPGRHALTVSRRKGLAAHGASHTAHEQPHTGLLAQTLSTVVECAPIELCPAMSSVAMPHISVLRTARNERRARYRAVNCKRANAHAARQNLRGQSWEKTRVCCCYEVADAVLPVS